MNNQLSKRNLHDIIINDSGIMYDKFKRAMTIIRRTQYSVLIDNLFENMKYQANNGINIIDYTGDKNDKALYILSRYLINMAQSNKPVRLYNLDYKKNIAHILKRI